MLIDLKSYAAIDVEEEFKKILRVFRGLFGGS